MAAGSGRLSCLARRTMDSVNAPPAEEPEDREVFRVCRFDGGFPDPHGVVECGGIGMVRRHAIIDRDDFETPEPLP